MKMIYARHHSIKQGTLTHREGAVQLASLLPTGSVKVFLNIFFPKHDALRGIYISEVYCETARKLPAKVFKVSKASAVACTFN